MVARDYTILRSLARRERARLRPVFFPRSRFVVALDGAPARMDIGHLLEEGILREALEESRKFS